VDRRVVVAASPREDDRLNLWSAQPSGSSYRSFSFAELAADEKRRGGASSQFVQRLASEDAGDWVGYLKGAALRLRQRFRDRRLRGVDAFIRGDIPAGAGLSASSALVVAVSEALVELNGLNVRPREFVDLCGEAEWFVGSGTSGNSAAMRPGGEREVISVSFLPFEIVGRHAFPQDWGVLVCHSGLSAESAGRVRERLRARVACYHMAREIIRAEFPEWAPSIRHLRDVNTRTLDISLPALYSLLKRVPTCVGPAEVEALASRHPDVAKSAAGLDLAQHEFWPRDVALYGLAECERARRAGDMLEQADDGDLGRMMNVSHDGDRVARWAPECMPFENRATDERMDSLIERAVGTRALAGSGAALWQQPGACRCSVPEIDLLVDRALDCPQVLGAQLAGAGVGGCVMVLVRGDSIEPVEACLTERFYEPGGIEPRMFACRPSGGSYILTSVEAR